MAHRYTDLRFEIHNILLALATKIIKTKQNSIQYIRMRQKETTIIVVTAMIQRDITGSRAAVKTSWKIDRTINRIARHREGNPLFLLLRTPSPTMTFIYFIFSIHTHVDIYLFRSYLYIFRRQTVLYIIILLLYAATASTGKSWRTTLIRFDYTKNNTREKKYNYIFYTQYNNMYTLVCISTYKHFEANNKLTIFFF